MREDFEKSVGLRGEFTATFKRFGSKSGFKGYPVRTALFCDVSDKTGKVKTDHIWFTVGKQMKELNLQAGDKISFVARITPYEKGYKGFRDTFDAPPVSLDYRLSFPNQFKKLTLTNVAEALQKAEKENVAQMTLI